MRNDLDDGITLIDNSAEQRVKVPSTSGHPALQTNFPFY